MTGGLGKGQKLILDALAAMESERGPGACRLSDLLKEAYRRSPWLQAKVSARKTVKEETWERMRKAAESGDVDAVRSYALSLIMDGWPRPRHASCEASAGTIAKDLDPSKIVARLARRGLVWRTRGAVGLTDAGRTAADALPLVEKHMTEISGE